MKEALTGKPIDRIDARLKVTGKAAYAAEIAVANVAYAVIVTSTIGRGRIVGLETTGASRMPGVLAVLTHENAAKLPGIDLQSGPIDRKLQVLQSDAVLYADQPIALVVADTLERAQDAAASLQVRYASETPTVDFDGERPRAYSPKAAGPAGPTASTRGDPDAALAAAKIRVEETYTTPPQNHNPMEMHATTAVWQADDRLTVYDATQGIFGVRDKLAAVFGIPKPNVRVISHYVGGGFGCKGAPWAHVILAAMAAKACRRGVKLAITRSQMFSFVGHRPCTSQKVALGADANGQLVAIKHDVISETSSFDEFVEPSAVQTRMLYACPNVATSHSLVRLDIATPTFMRAPGESTGTFALESAMDELSIALGIDPIDLRLRNHADADPDSGKPWSSKSLRECYRRGAEKFGWKKTPRVPRSVRDGRYLVGYGMATATYPARQSASAAIARLRRDGTALVQAGSQDIGTGTYTIMTQIAGDALGLPIERVRFELGDTAMPETPVSGGSQTASSTGSAVKRACWELRNRLVAAAIADEDSPLHGLAPGAIDVADGVLFAKNAPSRKDPFAAIVTRSGESEIQAKVDTKEKEERKSYSTHSFGAQFAEVKVDPDTLEIRVTRFVGAFAAGKILNPKTARSQLEGGMIWGIGLALFEHTRRDPRTGRVVSRDLADYHVPVHADVPAIDVIMVDEDDPYVNEIGAKGIGEIGVTGAGAAIANAVYHATGRRIRDLPITLDKLLREGA
jgi:xanthine dehydrogenase YagR molybdenum-binding subunit